jgi:hypothetical protein
MTPSVDELAAKAAALPSGPVAIEAFWDGDSGGWYAVIGAVLRRGWLWPTYTGEVLGWFRPEADDIGAYEAIPGAWPQAKLAAAAGQQLAERLGVPFYFPAAAYPEEECPRWWERSRATPCRRCGLPLLQVREPCPWRGHCYQCHLALDYEQRTGQPFPALRRA